MRFSEVRGNRSVMDALRGMVDSGRIPHAMLLHEDDGGGAMAIVQAFLGYLYCVSRHDGDSCASCPACNRVAKMIHPDIHYVFPVTTGSKVGTDKPTSDNYLTWWRELVLRDPYFFENDVYAALGIEGKSGNIAVQEAKSILSKLSLAGMEGGYRTVVIYLPEKMNVQAANSLLKMVEEPPENTLFVMITHAPEKVLKTIASRCLFMRVIPLRRADRDAVHPDENSDDQVFMDLFSDLMDALTGKDFLSSLECGEAIASLDSREKQKSFCKFAGGAVRNIFLLQQGMSSIADIPQQYADFYSAMAGKCRKTFPRAAMTNIDRALTLLERNVNQKILFTDLVDRLYTSI